MTRTTNNNPNRPSYTLPDQSQDLFSTVNSVSNMRAGGANPSVSIPPLPGSYRDFHTTYDSQTGPNIPELIVDSLQDIDEELSPWSTTPSTTNLHTTLDPANDALLQARISQPPSRPRSPSPLDSMLQALVGGGEGVLDVAGRQIVQVPGVQRDDEVGARDDLEAATEEEDLAEMVRNEEMFRTMYQSLLRVAGALSEGGASARGGGEVESTTENEDEQVPPENIYDHVHPIQVHHRMWWEDPEPDYVGNWEAFGRQFGDVYDDEDDDDGDDENDGNEEGDFDEFGGLDDLDSFIAGLRIIHAVRAQHHVYQQAHRRLQYDEDDDDDSDQDQPLHTTMEELSLRTRGGERQNGSTRTLARGGGQGTSVVSLAESAKTTSTDHLQIEDDERPMATGTGGQRLFRDQPLRLPQIVVRARPRIHDENGITVQGQGVDEDEKVPQVVLPLDDYLLSLPVVNANGDTFVSNSVAAGLNNGENIVLERSRSRMFMDGLGFADMASELLYAGLDADGNLIKCTNGSSRSQHRSMTRLDDCILIEVIEDVDISDGTRQIISVSEPRLIARNNRHTVVVNR